MSHQWHSPLGGTASIYPSAFLLTPHATDVLVL
jgi:hypothetical protein